jgi:hypothetical protein
MGILLESGKVDEITVDKVRAYLNDNQSSTPVSPGKNQTLI